MDGLFSIGVRTLAFAALNKSDALNAIVNRLSGGSINRDTLAQRVLRDAIQLGSQYAIDNKSLGARSAELVPLTRDVLVGNDLNRMKGAVQALVSNLVGDQLEDGSEGLEIGLVKAAFARGCGHDAAIVAETLIGDHALEKVVATHVKLHGWKPLEHYMSAAVGGGVLGSFVSNQVKAIMDRTMNKAEFDASASAEFRFLANVMNEFLIGDSDYKKLLCDYAPTAGPWIATWNENGKTWRHGVDSLAVSIFGPPEVTDFRECHKKAIHYAKKYGVDAEPAIIAAGLTSKLSDRDVFSEILRERAVAEAVGKPASTTEAMHDEVKTATRSGALEKARSQQLHLLIDKASPAQLSPLGARSNILAAYSITGRLDRVEASNHCITELAADIESATRDALAKASSETTLVNNFRLGEGYARHAGTLDIRLPASEYSYVDTVLESGRTTMDSGWSMLNTVSNLLGYEVAGASTSHQASTEIRQLYNTCGKNEAILAAVTRFLNPDVARESLRQPVLSQMQDRSTGLISAGEAYLELSNAQDPRIRFDVQRTGDMVTISLESVWDVKRFGSDPKQLRAPEGAKPSQLTATAVITVKPGPDDGEPTVSIYPMGVVSSVHNELQFEREFGVLNLLDAPRAVSQK